jgi:hypothetical protein
MTEECNCPYCPLIQANVQVCDVYVKVFDDGEFLGFNIQCKKEHKQFSQEFIDLAVYARNNYELKLGHSIDISKTGCTCTVYHFQKDIFKVCFHSQQTTTDDPQEQVIVMD